MKKIICIFIIILILFNGQGHALAPETDVINLTDDWKDGQLVVNNYSDLPDELLMKIFSFLEMPDRIRMSWVNKLFNNIIKEKINILMQGNERESVIYLLSKVGFKLPEEKKKQLKENKFFQLDNMPLSEDCYELSPSCYNVNTAYENFLKKLKEINKNKKIDDNDECAKKMIKIFKFERFLYKQDMYFDPRKASINQHNLSKYEESLFFVKFFLKNIKMALAYSYYQKVDLKIKMNGLVFDFNKKDKIKETIQKEEAASIEFYQFMAGIIGINTRGKGCSRVNLTLGGKEINVENFFEFISSFYDDIAQYSNELEPSKRPVRYYVNGIEGSALSNVINERLYFTKIGSKKSAKYFFKKFEKGEITIETLSQNVENESDKIYGENNFIESFFEKFLKNYPVIETLFNLYEKQKEDVRFTNDFKKIFRIAKNIDEKVEECNRGKSEKIILKDDKVTFLEGSLFKKIAQDLANVLQKKINLKKLYEEFNKFDGFGDKKASFIARKLSFCKNILKPVKKKKIKDEKSLVIQA